MSPSCLPLVIKVVVYGFGVSWGFFQRDSVGKQEKTNMIEPAGYKVPLSAASEGVFLVGAE